MGNDKKQQEERTLESRPSGERGQGPAERIQHSGRQDHSPRRRGLHQGSRHSDGGSIRRRRAAWPSTPHGAGSSRLSASCSEKRVRILSPNRLSHSKKP